MDNGFVLKHICWAIQTDDFKVHETPHNKTQMWKKCNILTYTNKTDMHTYTQNGCSMTVEAERGEG